MITIHGSPVSPFVRKVLVLLAEKEVPHEVNPISPFPPPESHLKISPLGKIPAMTDDDVAVPDSAAICGYIEKKHPDKPMYPSEPGPYGRALWYEIWASNELSKATAGLFFNRIAVKMMGREPDEAAIQMIINKVQPPIFDYLEAEIGDKEFLVDDRLTIADISVTVQFVQMLYSGESLPEAKCPNITRYVTAIMHRSSFKNLINADPFMKLD